MRNHDRSADDEPDAENLEEFVLADAGFLALRDVIADAVVAAQHQGCDEAEHFLGLDVERAALIRLRIEREEAAHDLVVEAENALVHALAESGEVLDAAHGLSGDLSVPGVSSNTLRRPLRSAATRSS